MKTFISIILLGSSFLSVKGFAQQLPLGSQYFMNPFTINPAYTGHADDIRIFLAHRSQFSSIAGSPQTTSLTVDAPTSIKGIGLGLNMYSDVTSILSRNGAMVNYSYGLNFGSGHRLTFGLAAGIIDNTINYQQAIVRDLDDPYIFQQKMHRTVFSADVGALYSWNDLEIGFAVPQLLGNMTKLRQNNATAGYFDMQQHFQGTAKYTFNVQPDQGITAYPMVMVRAVPGAPVQYDINAVADWKKWGWAAVGYHSNFALGVSIGVRYKNLVVGYARDIGISKIRRFDGRTNEFLLSYQFGNETRKRLDQHDKELEELRQRTVRNEEQIGTIQNELETIRNNENALMDSLARIQAQIDSLKEQMRSQSDNAEKTTSLTPENGNFRSYSSKDFFDENGNPMPVGYYVVIGSFGVKENALNFKNERQMAGETSATIVFNKKIKIHNVFVLYSMDYETAHAERLKQLNLYENTWVLKLE